MSELSSNTKLKNIIVTGATSGIGLGVCEAFLKSGNRVLALGRSEESLLRLKNEYGSNLLVFEKVDLSVVANIEAPIKSFCNLNGKIDGLVHCAGVEETVPISLYSNDKVKSIFEINVFAGIEILRVCAKKIYSNDQASFIFMSSVMGILGQAGKIGYCATKAAVLGMVKAAAIELSKRKIRVNAILPGIVNTPMTANLFNQLTEENVKQITAMHPLGLGEVEDVVPMISFLISDQSRWITGQNFIVDGGYSIQ